MLQDGEVVLRSREFFILEPSRVSAAVRITRVGGARNGARIAAAGLISAMCMKMNLLMLMLMLLNWFLMFRHSFMKVIQAASV